MIQGAEIDFIVTDSLKALELYEGIFQELIERVEVTAFPTGRNEAVFTVSGTRFHMLDENPEYMMYAPKSGDPLPLWFNIIVGDIRQTHDKALAMGCKQIQDVTEIEGFGASNSMFMDPFGYTWLLHEIHEVVSFEDRVRMMEGR